MPTPYSVDDFKDKIDSLYRLVIVAARRANQITKSETQPFSMTGRLRKSTVTALEEILADRVGYYTGKEDEEDYLE